MNQLNWSMRDAIFFGAGVKSDATRELRETRENAPNQPRAQTYLESSSAA
jgi:hypothetical protein